MTDNGICPDLAAQAASLTVGGQFLHRARHHGDEIAVEDEAGTITCAALNQRVNRLCHALAEQGILRGDRVAVLSENRREYLELFLAAAKLGVIVACQNWRQTPRELSHCVALSGARLALVSPRHEATLAAAGHSLSRVIAFGGEYERLMADSSEGEPGGRAAPEDGLVILYTSGTTGLPKGALISQRAMIARSIIARLDLQLFPGLGFVAWTPLYHMGSADYAFGNLMCGGRVILMDGFDPDGLAGVLARSEIGLLQLMPATVDRMIEALRRSGLRPRGVQVCGAMADLIPRHEIAEVTTLLNAPFRNTFGATETGPAPASRGRIPIGVAPERLSKLQSSLCEIRLVDEDDRDVPDGTPGELLFRGPSLFSGYWGDEEANRECFRGGWFHMGDVMVRNPDGSLDYVDRRKYLIKSGGENIYPAEIERVLVASGRVREAVVVKRPDSRWGEVPVAFVVAQDPALTKDDVIAICRDSVARYKVPRDVIFIGADELPLSTTGKVRRHELEARLR